MLDDSALDQLRSAKRSDRIAKENDAARSRFLSLSKASTRLHGARRSMAAIKKAVESAASSVANALSGHEQSASGGHPTQRANPTESLASTLKNGVQDAQDGGKEVLVYLVTLDDNGNPQHGKTVSCALSSARAISTPRVTTALGPPNSSAHAFEEGRRETDLLCTPCRSSCDCRRRQHRTSSGSPSTQERRPVGTASCTPTSRSRAALSSATNTPRSRESAEPSTQVGRMLKRHLRRLQTSSRL